LYLKTNVDHYIFIRKINYNSIKIYITLDIYSGFLYISLSNLREVTMSATTKKVQKILDSLTASKSARWAYLKYQNTQGEISVYKLLLNADFMGFYKTDLEIMKNLTVAEGVETTAKEQLIASIEKSVETEFNHEKNPTKNMITFAKGIKFHPEKNELYLHCLSLEKKILVPGVYKDVKSSELTLTKNRFKKMLKQSKIRFFKINLDNILSLSSNNNRIVIRTV